MIMSHCHPEVLYIERMADRLYMYIGVCDIETNDISIFFG